MASARPMRAAIARGHDGHLGCHHQPRQLGRGRLGGHRGADHPTRADHRDVVGEGEHLVELVRDEDDRRAGAREVAHRREEGVCLGGDQHRRRLVEDDDARVAIQHLEDLDTLTHPDAEIRGLRIDRNREARPLGELAHLAAGTGCVDEHRRAGLVGEDDVLPHPEGGSEQEVLVDDADPGGLRVARRAERHRTVVDLDRPLIGALLPGEDLHERRFARAVLADHGMHAPRADREIDPVVRGERPEPLHDAAQAHQHLLPVRHHRAVGTVILPSMMSFLIAASLSA
ncbi:MAG: hypothetical protein K0R81_2561 [Microbacterium sp.]|nr:hypothetical protein [Microbacterium sp.]